MSLNRFNAQRDENEPDIKEAYDHAGVLYESVNIPGLGDLIAQYNGKTFLVEIKMPKGKLTPAQKEKREKGWIIVLARTPEEALRGVGVPEDIIERVLLNLIVPVQLSLDGRPPNYYERKRNRRRKTKHI